MAKTIESQQPLVEALKAPEIRTIIKFILSRCIKSRIHHPIIEQVIQAVKDPYDLKKVLLYLESNDWCANNTIVQIGLDQTNITAYNSSKLVNRNADNPKLDRNLAKPDPDFDVSYLTLEIYIKDKTHIITYPQSFKFDPTSTTDIDSLNIWRHTKIRELVGLPIISTPTGEPWHPLQETFLLNRYAAQNVTKRGIQSEKITSEFNRFFEGTFLPGRHKPCERRTQNAVVSLLARKAINPRARDRRLPNIRAMSVIEKHEAAQARVKQERQEQADSNKKRDEERYGDKGGNAMEACN